MKKIAVLLVFVLASFLIGCGGDGKMAEALNPFGFLIFSFNTTKNPTLTDSNVRSLIRPAADGKMYAGTSAGLFSFDPTQITPAFTRVDTIALPAINRLVADGAAGDFFICTDNGLKKYTAATQVISDVNAADFNGKKVLTIKRQSDTVLWVGLEDVTAATDSMAKIDAGVATFFGTAEGMTASSVSNIYTDTNLVIACGTGSAGKGGLFKFNSTNNTFAAEAVNVGLAKGATALVNIGTSWYAAGPESGLIVSTNNRDTWATTALQNCSPVNVITEVTNTALGNRYWISTEKGVYLTYNFVDFKLYTTADGIPANSTSEIYGASDLVYSAHNAVAGGIGRFAFNGN